MTKEEILKQIQEKENLIARTWNVYQQLIGQRALLQSLLQEQNKKEKERENEQKKKEKAEETKEEKK